MNIQGHKEAIEKELRHIEEELRGIGVQDPASGEWEAKETTMDVLTPMADQNEAADKIEEYDENRAIEGELQIRYRELKAALARITAGTYGKCAVCGQEIEESRLEANPAANTCTLHL